MRDRLRNKVVRRDTEVHETVTKVQFKNRLHNNPLFFKEIGNYGLGTLDYRFKNEEPVV